jgi:UrcA family protein
LHDSPDTEESTMNTMTTSARFTFQPRSLIAAALVTAMISSFSAVCNAAVASDVPKTIVKYADLDLSTAQGATTLYNRIHFAAEGVCSAYGQADLIAKSHRNVCVKQAIEGAVEKVNQPALSAVYATNYGVPQPAVILTADRR